MSGGAKEGRIVGRKALSHYLGSCHCRHRRRATRIKLPIPLGPLRPSFPALAADGFGDVRAGAGGSSYIRCLMDVNIGVAPHFTVILVQFAFVVVWRGALSIHSDIHMRCSSITDRSTVVVPCSAAWNRSHLLPPILQGGDSARPLI